MLDISIDNEMISYLSIEAYTFFPRKLQFDTNNYAICHIYNDLTLFVGEIKKMYDIEIKGIGSIATVVGMVTIKYTIRNKDQEDILFI